MTEITLILGGLLITDAATPPIELGGVAVSGSRIIDCGRNGELATRYPEAERLDRTSSILIPGFINTHHHMYGVLSHGIHLHKPPDSFWPILRDYWWPFIEDGLTHENLTAAMDWACYEMINNGITTFYDCLEGTLAIPGALDAEAEILQRWGLRGFLSFEATERRSKENGQLGLKENADFIRKWNRQGGLVRGLMCFHTTFSCSREFIEQAVELGKELGTRVHMHVSEGTHEPEWCTSTFGMRTLEVYAGWGLLGPHTLASQCVQISPNEIRLLAEAGVHVSHQPLSNCEVGGGFSPVPEMLSAGINVSLGTDGYINDPFEVLRGALLMPKSRLLNPNVTTGQTVFEMATANGARSLGLSDVGRLKPGCAADLVVLGLNPPTYLTPHNIFDQVALWGKASDVTDVMVAGRWLKSGGRVLGGDPVELRARCREAAAKLWEACDV
jgi:5-methylthioadenosine/S-adenosylhomocysteine deaminase